MGVAMFGDSPDDEQLQQGWHQFCDQLKAAGDVLFRDSTPTSPVTRADGLRLLARNISLGLQFELENNNPDFPELLHYFDPLRKQGGDNTDALYVGAPVNGQHSYRITGHRGSARFFAVTLLEDGNTPWGGQVVATILGKDLQTDDEGDFELYISPDKHEGNWIQSSPGTYRVTFRQFFADWESEQPMRARIDCLSHEEPPPVLTIETVTQGLSKAARWVDWSVNYWVDMLDKWKAQPNTFLAYGELETNDIDFTPGGTPLISYWQLPVDEALLIRVKPPTCEYWAVEFGNYWWETMDYRYTLSNLNCHLHEREDNGELLVVVAHNDPGVPNWLDPCGHNEGYLTFRWIGADEDTRPVCEQVKVSQLAEHLSGAKPWTPGQRREQLRKRREGVLKRFPY